VGIRLGPEATSVIEAAREVARRHRHATLEPEHLLRALAVDARAESHFAGRGVDRERLVDRVEARLAEWPASGLYRDAHVEPAPAPGLAPILERARAERIISLVRPVTLAALARAACDEPRLAQLLFEAGGEIETLQASLAQARTLAVARHHDSVSVYHLMRALADQAWVARVFREAEVDARALRRTLESRLDAYVASDDLLVRFELAETAHREHLLVALLRTPAVEHLFWENEIAVVDVLRALVRTSDVEHDVVSETLPREDDGDVEIVFHNDDFTTMEFVVRTLSECFAVPAPRAPLLMLEVHRQGASVVRTCRAREARWRIEKARASAARAVMPLRISWRAVTKAAPGAQD
jgi:ATP-dependent Clp protease adaptor protein ClpS